MQLFFHSKNLREALLEERLKGKSIAFVPTMGNLHDAHLALIELALKNCDIAVASIFVNRMQFGLNEDWETYPRTIESDCEKLRLAGCHYLFNPDETEIYPNGMDGQTRITVPEMSDILCGASRPGHFEGVATVVTKLFNIVQPDAAIFGMKDYQQLAIIKRLAEDLCQPIRVIPGEIYRESDGLAMSSRNVFITKAERPRASQLNKSLTWVAERVASGDRDFARLEEDAKLQVQEAGFKPDYISVVDARSLYRAAVDSDQIIVLGAMYTEAARLIDNVPVEMQERVPST